MREQVRIRPARTEEHAVICAFDHVAAGESQRRRQLREWIASGTVSVAVAGGEVAGYVVFDHSFFERGFVHLLYVHPTYRRLGLGTALIRRAESLCRSARIFTSTNASNRPMQALLEDLGYRRSGAVDDLDPGDPELFYSVALRPADGACEPTGGTAPASGPVPVC